MISATTTAAPLIHARATCGTFVVIIVADSTASAGPIHHQFHDCASDVAASSPAFSVDPESLDEMDEPETE